MLIIFNHLKCIKLFFFFTIKKVNFKLYLLVHNIKCEFTTSIIFKNLHYNIFFKLNNDENKNPDTLACDYVTAYSHVAMYEYVNLLDANIHFFLFYLQIP